MDDAGPSPPPLSGETPEHVVGPELIEESDAPEPLTAVLGDSLRTKDEAPADIELGDFAPDDDAGNHPVPCNSVVFEDSYAKKKKIAASEDGEETPVEVDQNDSDSDHDHNIMPADTDQQGDEETPQSSSIDENSAISDHPEQDEGHGSIPFNPDAYLVEPNNEESRGGNGNANNGTDADDHAIDSYTEPLTSWFKQRRTKILLSLVCILAVVTIVALTVTFTTKKTVTNTTTEVILRTDAPTTNKPTWNPTGEPTMVPSSSNAPSSSPTTCAFKVASMAQILELPISDPSNPKISVDGKTAAVIARKLGTDTIYLTFYSLGDDDTNNKWYRNSVFTIKYPDSNLIDSVNYDIAVSGSTAFLGLPLNRNGAGLVYIFEMNDLGLWESVEGPLVPDDARRPGNVFDSSADAKAYFGYRVDINDGFAIVSAFGDKALYVFQKNGDDGQQWGQLSKLDLDYSPYGCFLLGQAIVVVDMDTANIHLHKYDEDLEEVTTLQKPIIGNPNLDEYQGLVDQVLKTGMGRMITRIRASEDYFVYSTIIYKEANWVSEGVFLYERQDLGQNFTLRQFFNASDYEEGFGWDLVPGKDILLIGTGSAGNPFGNLHTFVKQDGYFEESLVLEGAYQLPQIAGRNLVAITESNGTNLTQVIVLDLEDCHPAPTQLPSTSLAPIPVPSTTGPTSSASPTSTNMPSAVPSFSSFPSTTTGPSNPPTSSMAPTLCYNVKVTIMTTGANTEGSDDDVTSWELTDKDFGDTILQGGQLKENQIDEYEANCVQKGSYIFSISNSNGNGFGQCDTCGYFIFVNGQSIGGSVSFFDNEKLTFSLPIPRQGSDSDAISLCSGDFFLSLYTGEYPEFITWSLMDGNGDVVLSGGPYQKALATYRELACLANGEYTFTASNAGEVGSGSLATSSYFILSNNQIVDGPSDLNFGSSISKTFVLDK